MSNQTNQTNLNKLIGEELEDQNRLIKERERLKKLVAKWEHSCDGSKVDLLEFTKSNSKLSLYAPVFVIDVSSEWCTKNWSPPASIIIDDAIGKGGFNVVYNTPIKGKYGEDLVIRITTIKKSFIEEENGCKIHKFLSLYCEQYVPKLYQYGMAKTNSGDFYGVYSLMEKVNGKDLFDRAFTKKAYSGWSRKKNKIKILLLMLNIARAIQCLHNNNIYHLDIKGENIMLTYPRNSGIELEGTFNTPEYVQLFEDTQVKLIDFGLSVKDKDTINKNVGSKQYRAPELYFRSFPFHDIKGNIHFIGTKEKIKPGEERNITKADVWSLGVFLYTLLHQRYLYDDKVSTNRWGNKIKKKSYDYLEKLYDQGLEKYLIEQYNEKLSKYDSNYKTLLSNMLQPHYELRWDINMLVTELERMVPPDLLHLKKKEIIIINTNLGKNPTGGRRKKKSKHKIRRRNKKQNTKSKVVRKKQKGKNKTRKWKT